jgi:hypothetical protein
MQVQAMLFDLAVVQDMTPDTVAQRIRRENIEVYKLISKQVEQAAEGMRNEWTGAYGPLAREWMKLRYAELGLRGDIMHAMAQLTLTSPPAVREVLITMRRIGEKEEWGNAGEPADMIAGIELLEASGFVDTATTAALRERLVALYPAPEPE